VVLLAPGDDARQRAAEAVAGGADVIGIAGDDTAQAVLAGVAADHGVALVCVPGGHHAQLAADLGLDRHDPMAALAAFDTAVERRIDLASVNGRDFVDRVSLGILGRSVRHRSPVRRVLHRRTLARAATRAGPGAAVPDLRFEGPDGRPRGGAQIIEVSNNPYVAPEGGPGRRPRLDQGCLGIMTVHLTGARAVARFLARQRAGRPDRFPGWAAWCASAFEVHSGSPVEATVDGEVTLLRPPIVFHRRPAALRVRVPLVTAARAPTGDPPPSLGATALDLARIAGGRSPRSDAPVGPPPPFTAAG
jgi:diacylglycerol kinase family enzyme